MEQKNLYTCPRCGKQGAVSNIVPILDGVRYDEVNCQCGTLWRVYYKFENASAEITFMPPQEENEADSSTVEADPIGDSH